MNDSNPMCRTRPAIWCWIFIDAFTHLRTGAPCKDRFGLLNVILAEGLNLGLSKMAEASNSHDFFHLSRLSS